MGRYDQQLLADIDMAVIGSYWQLSAVSTSYNVIVLSVTLTSSYYQLFDISSDNFKTFIKEFNKKKFYHGTEG